SVTSRFCGYSVVRTTCMHSKRTGCRALARLSISAHADAYNVGLVLAGLRSAAFCYLWFKSGFIPRALAAWGMVASFLMGACAFSFIIFPALAKIVPVEIYGAPIFFFNRAQLRKVVIPSAGARSPLSVERSSWAYSLPRRMHSA